MEEKTVDPMTGLNDYIILTDKPTYLCLSNWRTVCVVIKDKEFIKFKADVWQMGSTKENMQGWGTQPKTFESTHVDFRKKINVLLANKDPKASVNIRAKIVNATTKPIVYDVELA